LPSPPIRCRLRCAVPKSLLPSRSTGVCCNAETTLSIQCAFKLVEWNFCGVFIFAESSVRVSSIGCIWWIVVIYWIWVDSLSIDRLELILLWECWSKMRSYYFINGYLHRLDLFSSRFSIHYLVVYVICSLHEYLIHVVTWQSLN
jgi:hypothetical protein